MSYRNLLQLSRRQTAASLDQSGYTLIELLITSILLGLLIGSGAYFVTQLIYNTKISAKQKAVDEWGRVDYLLETDIREAEDVATGSNPFGTCLGAPSDPVLALKTSYGAGSVIVYYNQMIDGIPQLRRCGPAVLQDGTLAETLVDDNIIVQGASLAATAATDTRFVDYQLTIPSLSVSEVGSARLRSRSYSY
jgi:prepilin-type N-terminal cleavage/methylation domain-containing protein